MPPVAERAPDLQPEVGEERGEDGSAAAAGGGSGGRASGSPSGPGGRRGGGASAAVRGQREEGGVEVRAGDLEVRNATPAVTRARTVSSASAVRSVSEVAVPVEADDPRAARAARRHSRVARRPARTGRCARPPWLEADRRAVGDDAAVVEDDDPVRDLVRLVEVVGGEQHGPALGGERRMSSQNARRLSTSMATVGSSRNTRSGSPAIRSRTAPAGPPRPTGSPPGGPRGRRGRQRSRTAAARRRVWGTGHGRGRRARRRAPPGRQAAGLEHRADPARPRRRRAAPSPSSRDRARGRLEQAEHEPMAVVLPAPLGPSRATVSPRRDAERDVVEGERVAEPAAHAVEGDGSRCRAGGGVVETMVAAVVAVMRRSSAARATARSHRRPERFVTRVMPES